MHCRYSPIRAVLDGSSQEEGFRINIYSYPPHAPGPIALIWWWVFSPSPFYICGFCKHRLKAVSNSKAYYLFNRVSRSFNRPLFIKQQHLRFEMTSTAIELQASGTSSNFQEIFRCSCAKFYFSPLNGFLFGFFAQLRAGKRNYALESSHISHKHPDSLQPLKFS